MTTKSAIEKAAGKYGWDVIDKESEYYRYSATDVKEIAMEAFEDGARKLLELAEAESANWKTIQQQNGELSVLASPVILISELRKLVEGEK
jgi:hypothetical protein